jgi:RNA polymerase sigma-70 factor, ECF subfamily
MLDNTALRQSRLINDPDSELVVRIARGDQTAAAELIKRHLSKLTALARHMLGDAAEAEDVAQEVFLKVWQNARKWEPGKAKFETWMHRVAVNLCYDRLRRRREVYTDQLPDREDPDCPAPDQSIVDAQLSIQIENALMHLPKRQRAALTLCHLREMSNIEAARIMEISVEALESLLARGRKGLRKHLAGEVKMLLEK